MLRRGFNVLAIEPDPDAARCLKENLEFHGSYEGRWLLDGRICHDRPGPVTFYLEPHKADSYLFPSTQRISKPVTLEADTLDHIVAERIGERSIHALKMDAEGAEPEALVGATKTLAQCCFVGVDASCERLGQSTMNECRRILEVSCVEEFSARRICWQLDNGRYESRNALIDTTAGAFAIVGECVPGEKIFLCGRVAVSVDARGKPGGRSWAL